MSISDNKFCVGLTGGIGSGKTLACHYFSELGVEIINADEITRTLLDKDTPYYSAIVERYGNDILDAKEMIRRKLLKEHIFNNNDERIWLEQLLHPVIWQHMQHAAENSKSPYVILEIPLLVETDSHPMIDHIIVIDVPQALQIQRTVERDQLTAVQIQRILEQQTTREKRLEAADDVIDNQGDRESLKTEVSKLHKRYLTLAAQQ